MIAVDSSAIVAILKLEPDFEILLRRLLQDDERAISAATLLETSVVLRTLDKASASDDALDTLVAKHLSVRDVTADHVRIAREAHLRFGKGMGHPAQFNFGDCFSYALAKSLDVPLLYKGGDFAKTDIKSAL
jgi:ribonuclease VapC